MKKYGLFAKVFMAFVVAAVAFGVYRYMHHKNMQKIEDLKEVEKFNNIESEIFNLADDDSTASTADQAFSQITDNQLSELTVEQLKGSGAEFIYQLIIKNQLQIAALKENVKDLKVMVASQSSKEKISKLIFSYIDLRQKIFEKKKYEAELEAFQLMVSSDNFLKTEVAKINENIQNFEDVKNLQSQFRGLIPELMATKKHSKDSGFFEKIRYSIAKVIVIRRNNNRTKEVDGVILRVQEHLENQEYENAIAELKNLDEKYTKILEGFMVKLNSSNEINKVDREILSYLRQLS